MLSIWSICIRFRLSNFWNRGAFQHVGMNNHSVLIWIWWAKVHKVHINVHTVHMYLAFFSTHAHTYVYLSHLTALLLRQYTCTKFFHMLLNDSPGHRSGRPTSHPSKGFCGSQLVHQPCGRGLPWGKDSWLICQPPPIYEAGKHG